MGKENTNNKGRPAKAGTKSKSGCKGTGKATEKKKKTLNPGVRVQGGRIYDSESGTTCHQCRQKTVELKAKCTDCTLYWCPRCLQNRYGQVVEEAMRTTDIGNLEVRVPCLEGTDEVQVSKRKQWSCPRCRGLCNCSNCRKKHGLEATGILANVSKAAGMGSVSELLSKNPNAKALSSDILAAAKPKAVRRKPAKLDTVEGRAAECGERDGDEGQLPQLQAGQPPRLFRGKRRRDAFWPAALAEPASVPQDCSAGDLAEVLEFLKMDVYDDRVEAVMTSIVESQRHVKAGLRTAIFCCTPFELTKPPLSSCSIAFEDPSAVSTVHRSLLDLVRRSWGIKGSVGDSGWQRAMKGYWRQERQTAVESRAGYPPREILTDKEGLLPGCIDSQGGATGQDLNLVQRTDDEPELQYPGGVTYWDLPAGSRLRMLRALCHDALDTTALRECVDKALESSIAVAKEHREEAATAQKECRQALQRERDRQIALLICRTIPLSIEQQRELVDSAKRKAVPALGPSSGSAASDPMLRTLPLGCDRSGCLYWKLQAAAVLTGSEDAVLAAKPWHSVEADEWSYYDDVQQVVGSLSSKGSEGMLRRQLCAKFHISEDEYRPTKKRAGRTGDEEIKPAVTDTRAAKRKNKPRKA